MNIVPVHYNFYFTTSPTLESKHIVALEFMFSLECPNLKSDMHNIKRSLVRDIFLAASLVVFTEHFISYNSVSQVLVGFEDFYCFFQPLHDGCFTNLFDYRILHVVCSPGSNPQLLRG